MRGKTMQTATRTTPAAANPAVMMDKSRYARCIAASKRIRWDIDDDVIRGRGFDFRHKFLPDSLSKVDELQFLDASEQRFLSQVQGRTYANLFGLIERYINAKILEVSQRHVLGDQVALEALVRFSDEELKHQELFRRIEEMVATAMPEGYSVVADPNELARFVLGKSTWAVLALTCHIELFTQQHYRQSIEPCEGLSPLYKDVFLFHWKEESQHAILDELEWRAENARLPASDRAQAVPDLISLVVAVDGMLQAQSASDAEYFLANSKHEFSADQRVQIAPAILRAYRWQFIVSGVTDPRFMDVLTELTTESELQTIQQALTPLLQAV
jgi:hypothetical protein